MNEKDKQALTERLSEGRIKNFQRTGKVGGVGKGSTGKPPFGYIWNGDELVVDESKARWVRIVYEMRADGLSLAGIKRELAANGVLTNNGLPFSRQAILNILNNPFYRGTVSYGGFVIEGHHQPII